MSNVVKAPATKESGLYDKGFLHVDGGIEVVVDKGQPHEKKVELEVKEYKICREAFDKARLNTKVYEFKDKTNLEILDEIFKDNNCTFKIDEAKSNDFILCRLVVLDKKKRDISGNTRQILDKMQEEKSCRVSDGSINDSNNKLGGKIQKDYVLIGVHNLWIEHLMFADEMGGLPMPSLAIINPDIPFKKYGEITLVAPKEMYDPKESAKNKLYNRDIFSPRFPTVYLKVDRKKLKENFSKYIDRYGDDTPFLKSIEDSRVRKLVYEGFGKMFDKIEEGKGGIRKIIAEIDRNYKVLLAFAFAKGIKVPIEYKNTPLSNIISSEPTTKEINFFKKLIDEKYPELKTVKHYNYDDKKVIKPLTDFYIHINTDKHIQRLRFAHGKKSIDDIIMDIGKERIEKNTKKGEIFYAIGLEVISDIQDLYNSEVIIDESKLRDYLGEIDGKFYEKHYKEVQEFIYDLAKGAIIGHYFVQYPSGKKVPMTLENIERYMKSQGLKGAENFFYGLSNAAAIAAKSYRSLREAKDDFDKIISEEKFDKFIENQKELIEKAEEVRKYYKWKDSGEPFFRALGKVGQYDNPTDEQILRIFRSEDFNEIPQYHMDDIRNASTSVRNAPTEYFEVKLKKSVKLDEFVGAIVPEHFTEGIEILKRNGIKVIETYDYNKDIKKRLKNRMEALNKVVQKTDVNDEVTFKDGGGIEEVVEVSEKIGIFNTDYSSVYFADKKGGFSYPKVTIVNENDVLSYQEPLSQSVVLVFGEKESVTPDYIQVNEIKFAVIPDTMNEIKPILNKHGVKFVTYDLKSSNLKEAKLNAVKSLLK